jgi:hypothetical protein
MKIIYNSSFQKVYKDFIDLLVKYTYNHNNPEELHYKYTININYTALLPPMVRGLCTRYDLKTGEPSPEFQINLLVKFGMDAKDTKHTIAHEFGHVRQMIYQGLIEDKTGIKFRQRNYPLANLAHDKLDWQKRPWELEAEAYAKNIQRVICMHQ